MSGDSLPVNWEEWKLSDVGDWFGGGTPSKSEERFWNGSIPWVSPKDMKVTSIRDAEDHISLDAVASSAVKIIPSGAVLFVTRSGILAHSFPVSTTRTTVTINQDLKAIVPFQPIDPEYLSWCLRAHARSILDRCTKDGTTVHSIEAPALKAYRVPIAPIEEQRRIVAKVEALFSELDKGAESLKTAREQLKVYRHAVLKQAFEGKLTVEWREENKDKLETPDRTLERIRMEHEADDQEQHGGSGASIKTCENDASSAEVTRKSAHRKPQEAISEKDHKELPPLPAEWRYMRLGVFIDRIEAGKSFKCDERQPLPHEVGVAKVSALTWGRYNENESKTCVDPEKVNPRYFIEAGDFLLSRANTVELVGACVIARDVTRKVMLSDKTLRIVFSGFNKGYILQYLRSHTGRSEIEKRSTGNQESMRNIGQERIRNIVIPVCSQAESEKIVSILEEKLSLTDSLLKGIGAELDRSDILRQSILKKAFSGQLVPQDPDDEPASVLLERILIEKDAQSKTTTDCGKRQPRPKRVALT